MKIVKIQNEAIDFKDSLHVGYKNENARFGVGRFTACYIELIGISQYSIQLIKHQPGMLNV